MESDLFSRARGRCDELLYGREYNRELFVVFLFEPVDFSGQIAVCVHEPAKLNKGPHDRDVNFDRRVRVLRSQSVISKKQTHLWLIEIQSRLETADDCASEPGATRGFERRKEMPDRHPA